MFTKFIYIALCCALFACANQPKMTAPAVSPAPERIPKALPEGSLFELLQAETAARRGKLDEALALFSHQTDITQSLRLAKTTARLAHHLQQYPAATNALALWLNEEPSAASALDLKARALIYNHHVNEAFDFIDANPNLAQQNLYVLLATETAKNKPEHLNALSDKFAQALITQPEHIGLLIGSGLILNIDQFDQASAFLAKARDLEPNNTVALSVQAALFAQAGKLEDAIELLQHGLVLQPDNFGLKRQLGRILSQTDIVAARTIFKELHERAPNDGEILFILAQISMKLEFYKEADTYLIPLQNNPQHRDFANYNLGLSAENHKELFIALNHYDQIDSGPYLLITLERYGKLAAQLSGIPAFEQRLEALKANNPKQALALTVYHIEYLLGLGLDKRAKPVVENGLDRFGSDSKLLYGQFLIAEQNKDYSQATESLRQILLQQPDNPVILNALGYTLSRHMDRHTEAKPFILQALALKPNDAAIIDSMGWVLLKLGDITEATRYLMQAYTQSTDTEIAAHLGEALWLGNEREQALSIWSEAHKADASNEELQDALKRFNVKLPSL